MTAIQIRFLSHINAGIIVDFFNSNLYGYNILFANKKEEWICARLYKGPIFCLKDQYSSVDEPDCVYSEMESFAFKSQLQKLPVFSGGTCAF